MKEAEESFAALMLQGVGLLMLAGFVGVLVVCSVFFGGVGLLAWFYKEFVLGVLSFCESSGTPHGATDGALLLKVMLVGLGIWALLALAAKLASPTKK